MSKFIALKFLDKEGQTKILSWPQASIYLSTTDQPKHAVYYRGKMPTPDKEIRIDIFCGPIDSINTKKTINIVKITGSIDDKNFSAQYENVEEDFILKLQEENKLIMQHEGHHPNMVQDIFSPIRERKRIDICSILDVERPAYARAEDTFTFQFLKDIYKSLGMKGYSSKSKEDLLDGILEKMTYDAEKNVPEGSSKLVKSIAYYEYNHKNAPKDTVAITEYDKAIGMTGRIVGKCFMSPEATPNPDARTLEAVFDIIEIVNPYDGLDEFLAEQEPKPKKKAKE